MAYTATSILGANSPAVGADRSTYTNIFDTAMASIDAHDHTSGKGIQIPTGGIANLAVTTGKIADLAVSTDKLADLGVTTAKVAEGNITTSKVADGAITQAKRAALGQQISSSSGAFSTGSTSFTDVTNLSVSITTTGRPVMVMLVSDASGNESYIGSLSTSPDIAGSARILRDAVEVGTYQWVALGAASGSATHRVASSVVKAVDVPGAGTYTYKAQIKAFDGSNTAYCYYAKLVAFEL